MLDRSRYQPHFADPLTHPSTESLGYRADIDGLRALSIVAVVAFHAFPDHVKGGFVGVDVFFVISGYLITRLIVTDIAADRFTLADFYFRRIRRLFPALIVVFLACLLFGWHALLQDEFEQIGKHIFAGSTFVANFVFWRESGYFDAALKPLVHLWSLGVEEQFYLLWPAMLFLVYRFRWNPLSWAVLVAVRQTARITAAASWFSGSTAPPARCSLSASGRISPSMTGFR
jgi:peptidoglycan/LPS O-acetylase OafA/YrhL